VARAYLKLAGAKSVEELQRLPARVLLRTQKRLLSRNEFGGDTVFGPVVDGATLPEPPLHAIRAGCARDVALLTGTTLDEARLWSLYVPVLRWAHPHALESVLGHAVGDRWNEVISAYRRSQPDERPGNLSMAINGDLLFRMPAIRLAEAQATHRPEDTRMYLFAWRTPKFRGRLGAPHAIDVPFIFGNLEQEGVKRYTGDGSDRIDLSNRFQDAWLAFARTGDPNHAGLPQWPPYRPESRSTIVFDATTTVVNDPRSEERVIWGTVPFDGVAPAIENSLPTTGEILRSFLRNPFARA
jgi:para-nitrobenzyl esterase